MTKTTLLTATAIAAMAFAGAASAQTITSASVSGQTVLAGTTSTPYTVANEANIALSANRVTNNAAAGNAISFRTTFAAGTTTAQPLETGSYTVTVALSGTANPVFSTALTDASLTNNGTVAGCATTTLSSNGQAGQNTATFSVVVNAAAAGCTTAPTSFTINPAYEIQQIGTAAVSVTAGLASGFTPPVGFNNRFAATTSTQSLIASSNGYRVFVAGNNDNVTGDGVDNADLPTILALGSGVPFRTLAATSASNDDILGGLGAVKSTVAANTAAGNQIFANLSATALPDIRYNVAVNATNGNFGVLVPALRSADTGGTTSALTVGTPNTSATLTSASGAVINAQNVVISVGTAQTASISTQPLSYTATVTPVLTAADQALIVQPAAVSGNLESIGIDGTNFLAPWFSGSQAQTQSQVRLSNTGATAAQVNVAITNGVFNLNGTPTTFGDATCATGAFTLPVDGDLVLSNAVINSCFGAFLRGDLRITVQAASGAVTAKMRNTSAAGTFETTLGRYSGTNVAGN